MTTDRQPSAEPGHRSRGSGGLGPPDRHSLDAVKPAASRQEADA